MIVITGTTKKRLHSLKNFFLLSGSMGLTGELEWWQYKKKRIWHWKVEYRGPYTAEYKQYLQQWENLTITEIQSC